MAHGVFGRDVGSLLAERGRSSCGTWSAERVGSVALQHVES